MQRITNVPAKNVTNLIHKANVGPVWVKKKMAVNVKRIRTAFQAFVNVMNSAEHKVN